MAYENFAAEFVWRGQVAAVEIDVPARPADMAESRRQQRNPFGGAESKTTERIPVRSPNSLNADNSRMSVAQSQSADGRGVRQRNGHSNYRITAQTHWSLCVARREFPSSSLNASSMISAMRTCSSGCKRGPARPTPPSRKSVFSRRTNHGAVDAHVPARSDVV